MEREDPEYGRCRSTRSGTIWLVGTYHQEPLAKDAAKRRGVAHAGKVYARVLNSPPHTGLSLVKAGAGGARHYVEEKCALRQKKAYTFGYEPCKMLCRTLMVLWVASTALYGHPSGWDCLGGLLSHHLGVWAAKNNV